MTVYRKERKVVVVKGLSCLQGSPDVEGSMVCWALHPVVCGKVCVM